MQEENFKNNWKDIVFGFLKLGATAYGGPAIYGILQAELQEKRQWVTKECFVEGVSLGHSSDERHWTGCNRNSCS
jgi:chromate transport protein ChrA